MLKTDPDIDAAPAEIRPLLRRCLERDVRKRLGWIGDARERLDAPAAVPTHSRLKWFIPVLAGTLLLAAVVAGLWLRAPKPQEAPVRTFKFTPPNLFLEPAAQSQTPTISPDGKHIAYVAADRLWIQDLDRDIPRVVESSENAVAYCWSTDSQWLAFFARGQIWRVLTSGGSPMTLSANRGFFYSCAWNEDGNTIVWTGGRTLNAVSVAGGQSQIIFDSSELSFARSLYFLPSQTGAKVLVSLRQSRRLFMIDLVTKRMEYLGITGTSAAYSPTGHILYAKPSEVHRSEIWALPFDLKALKPSGPPFPVIAEASGISLSNDGTLVFTDELQTQIVVRDRTGKQTGTLGLPQSGMTGFAVSKGGVIATSALGDGNLDIWIHDAKRGVKTRFSSHVGDDWVPRWAPDGKSIAFSSDKDGSWDVYKQPLDGTSPAVKIAGQPERRLLGDWSNDGRHMVFVLSSGLKVEEFKLGYFHLDEQGKVDVSRTLYVGLHPRISPDGRFIAFTDADEVYVKPFPDGPGKWQISPKGGIQPRWSHDGKEIYYFEGNRIMAASVTTQGGFSVGPARSLFAASPYSRVGTSTLSRYETLPDGSFALLEAVNPPGLTAPSIHVLQNFPAFLKRGQAAPTTGQ